MRGIHHTPFSTQGFSLNYIFIYLEPITVEQHQVHSRMSRRLAGLQTVEGGEKWYLFHVLKVVKQKPQDESEQWRSGAKPYRWWYVGFWASVSIVCGA